MTSTTTGRADSPGLLTSLWRFKWAVAAVTILAAVGAYLYAAAQDPVYEATATVFLKDPSASSVFGNRRTDLETYVPQQEQRLGSADVLERAAALLTADVPGVQADPAAIRRATEVQGDVELGALEITSSSQDPILAAATANAMAAAYDDVMERVRQLEARNTRQPVEAEIAELDEEIEELRQELGEDRDPVLEDELQGLQLRRTRLQELASEIAIDAITFGSGVEFIEAADVPAEPTNSPLRSAVLVGLIVLTAATAAAYWAADRTASVDSRRLPEAVLGIPLLGAIPAYEVDHTQPLPERVAHDLRTSEAYQFVLSAIEYALEQSGGNSVVVTSIQPGEGKSETSLQLAVGALFAGRSVVLVDGDLRMRRLSRSIGAEGVPGLVEVADGTTELTASLIGADVGFGALLPVLPAGRARTGTSGLPQASLAPLFERLAAEAELVFVDSAPLLAVAETSALANAADGIVLVIREGLARRKLEELSQRLRFVRTPVLGYVYVTPRALDGTAYGYGLTEQPEQLEQPATTAGSEPVATPEPVTPAASAAPGTSVPQPVASVPTPAADADGPTPTFLPIDDEDDAPEPGGSEPSELRPDRTEPDDLAPSPADAPSHVRATSVAGDGSRELDGRPQPHVLGIYLPPEQLLARPEPVAARPPLARREPQQKSADAG